MSDRPSGAASGAASDRAPWLDVRGLWVEYGASGAALRALDGIELELEAGGSLALVGESGAGKSSALAALIGLLPPGARSGAERLWLGGSDLRDAPPAAWRALRGRAIGCVFQDALAHLDPVLRVGAQLEEVLVHAAGLARAASCARALELLERVGLPDPALRARAFPHELSGGQRQRVGLALALACEPALLLADEPTANLDAELRAGVEQLLARELAERRMALLLVTHDLALAGRLAERIAVLYAGRIVECGPSRELLARPRHPYTLALLRARPERLAPGAPLSVLPGAPPAAGERVPGCRFHPRCALADAHCRAEEPRWTDRASLSLGAERAGANAAPADAPQRSGAESTRGVACHRWREVPAP